MILTTRNVYMNTIDEQLDAANAELKELKVQVETLKKALQDAEEAKTVLETANAELADNLSEAKERLAKQETATRDALTQVEQLKAEAKTAEERAAEFYGADMDKAAEVTARGDNSVLPVAERLKTITSPAAQTQFLRSLSEAERAELFSNI